MSHDEMNAAIAKACNWEPQPEGTFHPDYPVGQTPPNYSGNRDEMQSALKRIAATERDTFQNWLSRIVEREHRMATVSWLWITATAAQLAEAFLRTKGLWK